MPDPHLLAQTALDAVQVPIFWIAPDSHVVYVNGAGSQLLGYTVEELLDLSVPDFDTNWSAEYWRSEGWERLRRERLSCFESELRRKDGALFPVEVLASHARFEGEEILFAVPLDITDRVVARRALATQERMVHESEARYRSIVEDQTEFIVRWTPDGTRTFVNDSYCRYFDQPSEELIGTSFFPLIAEADLDKVRRRLRSLTADAPVSTDEHRVVCPDGTIRWQSWTDRAVFDQEGRLLEMQSVGRDVTERKRAELALAERLRFQSLIAEVSATLLLTPAADIDREIERGLKRIGDLLSLDRVSIRWMDKKRTTSRLTHRWQQPWSLPLPVTQNSKEFPGLHVARGETLRIARLDELPPEVSAKEVESLRALNTKSLLALPLTVSDQTLGIIHFATEREEREWPGEVVKELQVLGEIIASALVRARAEKELQDALTEVARLKEKVEAENAYLRGEVRDLEGFEGIVGESDALLQVLRSIEQAAPTDVGVLVLGETGTGKELVARALHSRSPRSGRPFVKVDCSALSGTLIESALFGHEKGAFTGATARTPGRFELADGGTVFLDEIGELPPELQVKLLRVLQDGEFERLGSPEVRKTDVRVIAATNRDLDSEVTAGTFRTDLYYRLSVFPIKVPPLRARRKDIPLLVWHFISRSAEKLRKRVEKVPVEVLDALIAYDWPGNVREMQNVIERAVILSPGSTLVVTDSVIRMKRRGAAALSEQRLEDVERDHILGVVEESGWKIRGKGNAADRLGMNPSTLRSRMKKLGIQRPGP